MSDQKNYRWKTFKHWANLAFVGGAGIAAAAGGGLPLLGLAALVEAGVLWIAPDIKGVQRALDISTRGEDRERKRRYYAHALWGVGVPKSSPASMFVEEKTDWHKVLNPDWGRGPNEEQRLFLRLLEIVVELEAIQQHRPEALPAIRIEQVDDAINMWLQRLYIAKGIQTRLNTLNQADLVWEFEQLQDKAKRADSRADKIVIGERLRSLKQKVEELPKLEQRLGLARAEAERIVDEVESFLLQVRTAGTSDVAMLDGLVDRYDMLDSDFDRVLVASEVRGMLSGVDDESAWDDVAEGLGIGTESKRVDEVLK
jgi:hypothetical protein